MQYCVLLEVPDDENDSIERVCRDLNDLLKVSGALSDASARPLSEVIAC